MSLDLANIASVEILKELKKGPNFIWVLKLIVSQAKT
jgi:hypothetical protein